MGNTPGKSASSRSRAKKSVHWLPPELPTRPSRPQLVASSDPSESDVVTIRWERPANDGGSPIIGYLVEHKRTGSPHWVRATPGLVSRPELSISGLEPGWRYQFRVTAQNAIGPSLPSEMSEPLTVTLQRNIIIAPRFIIEPVDKSTLENESVEFEAEVTGIPVPSICWYKDDCEIFSSRRTRITTENGRSVLIIYQTALVDEGEIKCTATNKAGFITAKARLDVQAPPRIRLPRQYEDGLLFELDEMVRLKVTIAGKPDPDIFWYHNGESIVNDPRYEITNADRTSSLKVTHAKRSDRGEYQIRAVNSLGEHTASFLVTVTDRPTPPQNVKIISLGKSVTLTWSAPEDDGGCKIGNYIIEYYRVGWNVWLKAGTSRKLSMTLGELIEGSEYRFRLKAENPYGISEPSEETETIFIPDPKRGMLQPPVRSKSQPKELENNLPDQNIHHPVVMSVASSKSSLNSRPTSPVGNEPVRPMRGIKYKTPTITPDPSPITHRKDIHDRSVTARNTMNNSIFDRSSMVRELTYGSSPQNRTGIMEMASIIPKKERSPQRLSPSPQREIRSKSPEPIIRTVRTQGSAPPIFLEQNPRSHENLDVSHNDDILHGSSEFMLVLLPNRDDSAKRKGGSTSNLFDFEDAVAPPMSLSAPELGFEPPFLGSLRYAVSSSELLHERAMMRFYEATQNEQAEKIKNAVRNLAAEDIDSAATSRRCSLEIPGIPTIRVESEEAELLERKHSLRRRLSGSGISQQMLWQRRLSWKAAAEHATIESSQEIPGSPKKSPSPTIPIQEEAEERPKSPLAVPAGRDTLKLGMVRQRSKSEELEEQMFEQVRAKMAKQNSQEEKKEVIVASEDKWEEEETKVVEEEEELEEEEEEEEEELSDDDRPGLEEDIIPAHVSVPEEETYHPRMMIPRQEATKDVKDLPFEILTKPSPLPDPNFIPKPILKTKRKETEPPEIETSPGRKSPVPEKPQRKNLPIKETSGKFLKNITGPLTQLRNKLPISSTPSDKFLETGWSEQVQVAQPVVKSQPVIVISAAEAAQKKRLESRQSSLEEAKVVIDHYTDIVKEFGRPKKQNVPLFLDTDALKKAAEEQERPQPQDRVISERRSPNMHARAYVDQSSEESLDTRLKKTLDKIESSNESLEEKQTPPPPRLPIKKQIEKAVVQRPKPAPEVSVKRPLKLTDVKRVVEKPVIPIPAPVKRSISKDSSTSNLDEKLVEVENKVRSTIDYTTDVAMFLVACWLYLFHNALLAVPVLILMVYRQLRDEMAKYWPPWPFRKGKK